MSNTVALSRQAIPPAVNDNEPVTKSQLTAASGGGIALSELYRPMTGVWPAVDATNGPLTADGGIVSTLPSLTGYSSLIPWNTAGRFNVQGQNWLAAPTAIGPAANQCAMNHSTSRGLTWMGITGFASPSIIDFSFVSDTAKLIVAYWQFKNNQQFLGISTSYHEVDVFVEHEGRMKGIRAQPAVWPTGSTGDQLMFREITFKEARSREFRVMLSAGCYFAGIYVDTGADVQPAPNRPLLFGYFGDSWGDAAGNVFNSIGGNTAAAGVNWPSGCSLLRSNTAVAHMIYTGGAGIFGNQGATGYFVNNSSGLSEDDTVPGFSPFCSQGQVNFFGDTFGSRYPIPCVRGGWNDGTAPGTPYLANYQARAEKVYRKLFDKLTTQAAAGMPLLVEGIQCKSITAGDYRDLSNQGLANAVVTLRDTDKRNAFFVDNILDRKRVAVQSTDFGPDGIHLDVKGDDHAGQNFGKKIANVVISSRYVALTRAAIV